MHFSRKGKNAFSLKLVNRQGGPLFGPPIRNLRPKRNNLELVPYWMKHMEGLSTPHHLAQRSVDREHQCYYNPSACF